MHLLTIHLKYKIINSFISILFWYPFLNFYDGFGIFLVGWTKASKIDRLLKRGSTQKWKSLKIKLNSTIVMFAFFFSKSVSFSSDIHSGLTISIPGPALSLPWLQAPALLLLGPTFSLLKLHYHFQDLHYFYVTFPSRKVKHTEENEVGQSVVKCPFWVRKLLSGPSL